MYVYAARSVYTRYPRDSEKDSHASRGRSLLARGLNSKTSSLDGRRTWPSLRHTEAKIADQHVFISSGAIYIFAPFQIFCPTS